MGTFGLETVHVGDVADGIDLSIGCRVRVGAAHGDCLVLGTGVFQLSLLLVLLAIASLHAVSRTKTGYTLSYALRQLPLAILT